MTGALQSMVASTYVADIDTSCAFYQLLGFREHSTGRAATSAWCYLEQDGYNVLLASTRPPLKIPKLPLHFYFFYDDVDAVTGVLRDAGVPATHMGYPPHALGGEIKILDPDGNTVLLGQRERSPSQVTTAGEDDRPHFSLLREAAAVIEAPGTRCRQEAEVKLADPGGDAVWACLGHAEEVLMTVHGAFIASQDEPGIAQFLDSRR